MNCCVYSQIPLLTANIWRKKKDQTFHETPVHLTIMSQAWLKHGKEFRIWKKKRDMKNVCVKNVYVYVNCMLQLYIKCLNNPANGIKRRRNGEMFSRIYQLWWCYEKRLTSWINDKRRWRNSSVHHVIFTTNRQIMVFVGTYRISKEHLTNPAILHLWYFFF